jgi:hypothetical protein
MADIKDMATFTCHMEQSNSKTSFGLQLLDVVLWLMKRCIENPQTIRGKALDLAHFVETRRVISNFSHEKLVEEVGAAMLAIESAPISKYRLERARELRDEMESARLARMRTLPGG